MPSTVKSKNRSSDTKATKKLLGNEHPIFGFDLFDSLPDMYFLLDTKGEILNLNK